MGKFSSIYAVLFPLSFIGQLVQRGGEVVKGVEGANTYFILLHGSFYYENLMYDPVIINPLIYAS